MALSNLTDLEAALKDFAGDRTDLSTSAVDNCITLAEGDITDGIYDPNTGQEICPPLRAPEMETKTDPFTLTGEFTDLPSDFLEMREAWPTSSADVPPLEVLPPSVFDSTYGSSTTGPSVACAVVGTQLRCGPGASAGDTLRLLYYAKIPGLVANSSNWLMTKRPNVYLYGGLLHLAPYIDAAPNLVAEWQARFISSLKALNVASQRAKWGGGPMRARPMGATP